MESTIKIRLAIESEVTTLTQMSKEAFDTDISVGGSEIGGAPDYDNVSWHSQMVKEKHLYSVLIDNQLVGGALVFRDEKHSEIMYVGRIFIAPQFHRRGYGMDLMLRLENLFPEVNDLRLDTPIWNVRTNQFYQKYLSLLHF